MTLSELTEENRELTEGDDYLNALAIKDLLKNKKNEEALQLLEHTLDSMEKSKKL